MHWTENGKRKLPFFKSTTPIDRQRKTTVRWHRLLRSLLYLIAWIFMLLVVIGNISNRPVLRNTYFLYLDLSNIIPVSIPNAVLINSIAQTIGLHDFYQVGLWNFCEGYDDQGITHCSKPETLYAFNPVEIILNELLAGATGTFYNIPAPNDSPGMRRLTATPSRSPIRHRKPIKTSPHFLPLDVRNPPIRSSPQLRHDLPRPACRVLPTPTEHQSLGRRIQQRPPARGQATPPPMHLHLVPCAAHADSDIFHRARDNRRVSRRDRYVRDLRQCLRNRRSEHQHPGACRYPDDGLYVDRFGFQFVRFHPSAWLLLRGLLPWRQGAQATQVGGCQLAREGFSFPRCG